MALQPSMIFINRTQKVYSRREKELLAAYAKSHASRVSRESSKWRRLEAERTECFNSPWRKKSPAPQYISEKLTTPAIEDTGIIEGNDPVIQRSTPNPSSKSSTGEPDKSSEDGQPESCSEWNTPWHWSKGYRVDPFNCVPWASKALAEFDLCEGGTTST
jgi:hypothetical protein